MPETVEFFWQQAEFIGELLGKIRDSFTLFDL
ncbi:hypothetical protein BAL199_25694 [alpha proteobacterium BAL199]|nr:hypothetical protein BAL199_25694 [alpha proteobacterium BAL199]